MNRVRIGIVGPSWWVNYWHLPAIELHPAGEITAVCGEADRSAESVRERYGPSARYYRSYGAMLDAGDLDAVIVCTPNDLHHPVTMAALSHGLHISCEKPLALNAAQAREMCSAAEQKNVVAMTNFPYRDNPAVRMLHDLIDAGSIGAPLHVYGQYHSGGGLVRPRGWRGLRARSGAGILADLGSHLIDLTRYALGREFTALCGHLLTAVPQPASGAIPVLYRTEDPACMPRNDDSAAFVAELSGGVQGVFHTSWVANQGAAAQSQRIDVYGSEGRLTFTATHAGTKLVKHEVGAEHSTVLAVPGTVGPAPGGQADEDHFRPGRLTQTNTTYRWIDAIRTRDRRLTPNFTDGLRAQEVIDAVIQASANRRWLDVAG